MTCNEYETNFRTRVLSGLERSSRSLSAIPNNSKNATKRFSDEAIHYVECVEMCKCYLGMAVDGGLGSGWERQAFRIEDAILLDGKDPLTPRN